MHINTYRNSCADTVDSSFQDEAQALLNVFHCDDNETIAKCCKNRCLSYKHLCERMFATPAESKLAYASWPFCTRTSCVRKVVKGFKTGLSFYNSVTTVILVVYSVTSSVLAIVGSGDWGRRQIVTLITFSVSSCLLLVNPILSFANLEVKGAPLVANVITTCTSVISKLFVCSYGADPVYRRMFKRSFFQERMPKKSARWHHPPKSVASIALQRVQRDLGVHGSLDPGTSCMPVAAKVCSRRFIKQAHHTTHHTNTQIVAMVTVASLPIARFILFIWAATICVNCLAAAYCFATKPRVGVRRSGCMDGFEGGTVK